MSTGLDADTLPTIDVAYDDKLYNASTGSLLEVIRGEDDAQVVFLLAHNPGISLLALELGRGETRAEELLREGFATATLAVFEIRGEWPSLSPTSARLLRLEHVDRDDVG